MNTIDGPSIKKKSIIKLFSLMFLFLITVICCYKYHNLKVYESINVVVSDTATIEYGSANYDILELVKEVEGEIVSIKKDIDTNTLGEQELVVEVKKDNIVKDIPVVVSIIDTVAPYIEIKNEKVSITKGDEYNLNDNIISVKDEIDGDLELKSDVSSNSLKYYNFQYDNIESVGEHNIIVNAVDSSGNCSSIDFILEVKEPVKSVYYDLAPNASSNEIVKVAYSLVGLPYVAGGTSPSGFDCSGFVQYVYSRVGINISRSTSTQINDGLPVSYENAMPGDILLWGYGDGNISHSALYIGNGQMIHAANPNQGVIISDVNSWIKGSGSHIISTRRI